MLDRQRTRREAREARETTAVRVEDVIPPELLDGVGDADRDYLEQVFREPQKFLPPRTPRAAARPAEPPEEPESRLARRAKQAGLVGAGALVAGAVVTAALLSGGPRPTAPVAEDTLPTGFSGAAALGGAAVPDQPSPSAGGTTDATSGHRRTTSSSSGSAAGTTQPTQDTGQNQQQSGPPSPPAPSTPASVEHGKATGRTSLSDGGKLQAVKKFYSSIDKNPDNALALLAPGLADGETGNLVRAWSDSDEIDVQSIDVQDDGSVLAVAVLRQADGSLVRVTQQFDVVERDVISAARLLSAVSFS